MLCKKTKEFSKNLALLALARSFLRNQNTKREIANTRNMGRSQSWSTGVHTQSGEIRKGKAQLQIKLTWGTKAKKVNGH